MLSNVKKISVERALDLLELSVVGHHDYIYEDIFDFMKTLVVKCSVDPNYILKEYKHIYYETCYGDFSKIVKEVETHVIDLSEDEINKFENIINSIKIDARKEIEKKEERIKEIKEAKERYKKLKYITKYFYILKDGKPIDKNFDNKTTDDVQRMYQRK